MATVEYTLGAAVSVIPIPSPTGSVKVKKISGAAPVYGTIDGSLPGIPSTTPSSGDIKSLVNLGEELVFQPILYGDHMVAPTLQLVSPGGTSVVTVSW